MLTRREELVLKADVERSIRVRRERHPRLPHNVLRSSVLVAHGVLDLQQKHVMSAHGLSLCTQRVLQTREGTDMHVDLLPITFLPVNNRGDEH